MEDWISVEDRLPDIGVEVIVCDNYRDVYTDYRRKDNKDWNEPRKYIIDIYYTHWMPFPKPPKKIN